MSYKLAACISFQIHPNCIFIVLFGFLAIILAAVKFLSHSWSPYRFINMMTSYNCMLQCKGEKFDFFLILILDRLDYNKHHWILFLAKYLLISEKNTNNKIPLKSSFLAANYCTSLRASRSKTNHYLVFLTLKSSFPTSQDLTKRFL